MLESSNQIYESAKGLHNRVQSLASNLSQMIQGYPIPDQI